ncbi:basic helix-loop-helix (bHLH) DNA-binding superfamily protein [Wolffia australiana]
MDGLRALVGRGGWDICVLWELSADQRSLELKLCCCGGVDLGGEENAALSMECRDSTFPHRVRTAACAALAELPSSVPLDSTPRAQVFLSGIPAWTHPSHSLIEERRTTRVFVPVAGGVVELYIESFVPEDPRTVEIIAAQFTGGAMNGDLASYAAVPEDQPPWVLQPDQHGFHWDQPRLCVSPLDLFDGHREEDAFFEGSSESVHGFHHPRTGPAQFGGFAESTISREILGHEKDSVKQEGEGRTDSFLDGSDDDDQKLPRSERRPSCKNLMAERKRRKKLNDRLYDLRSLVPKISKMDKASILGDAIEFVKDLQSQVKKLQAQLEETTPLGPCEVVRPGPVSPPSPSIILSSAAPREKKENQMEPQVEVSQVGANKFFLRVFCEHRRGGFVRLMEAMASLGFDVVSMSVTTSEPLVLNVFEVEKRDSEAVLADQVRSSLLRLAMDPDDSRLQL